MKNYVSLIKYNSISKSKKLRKNLQPDKSNEVDHKHFGSHHVFKRVI